MIDPSIAAATVAVRGIRFLAAIPIVTFVMSGCNTPAATTGDELTVAQAALSVSDQQSASTAARAAPVPVSTRQAQVLPAEEAKAYLKEAPTPLGPAPSLQDATAAIKRAPSGANMSDLVRDYLRAVAQLPVSQQESALQSLGDYVQHAGGDK